MLSRFAYIAKQTLKFLSFRGLEISNEKDANALMFAGILFAWIAGIGRYWDHPTAHIWQYAGLGSVAYIFVLSFLIWAIVWPIRPPGWRYKSVLIFVGLTSPLAWLYAIPVERFTELSTAVSLNIWFLAIVATWRVALYVQFLRKVGKLSGDAIFIISLLPLTLIMFSLAMLNLEQAVFEIMAGLGDERTGGEKIRDGVYAFISLLGAISMVLAPLTFLAYLAICFRNRRKNRK